MGLVTESLLDTDALSSRPTLRTELCLNRMQRRWSCSRCAEICPHGVFPLKSGDALRWDFCTDCNLCVSACPTRALLPSAPERRIWAELPAPEGPIRIGCRKEEKRCDARVGCLAAIPWELLAALALRNGVVLSMEQCVFCDRAECKELLQDNIQRVKNLIGEDRCGALLRLTDGETEIPLPAGAAAEEKAVTRRELFSGIRRRLGKSLASAAEKRLPFLSHEDAEPLGYRLLLSETVNAELRQEVRGTCPDYGVSLPRFNTNCFGCGICEKICPHRALSIQREEGGTRLISIEAKRCTGCLLCVRLCPHGGLDGLEPIRVPHLEKLPLVRVKSLSCERCGAVLLPGTEPPLCRRCAEREKKRRV